MVDAAESSHHLLAMIGATLLLLILLSVIFYRFVAIYQSMRYEGEAEERPVYAAELAALALFAAGLLLLITPTAMEFLGRIA
jgi:hydrogenase-4 component F